VGSLAHLLLLLLPAGAAAITGKVLSRIEIHGKNLFYFFSGSSGSNGSGPGSSNTAAAAGNLPPSAAATAGDPVVLSPEDEDPLAEPGELHSGELHATTEVHREDDDVALPFSPVSPMTPGKRQAAGVTNAFAAAAAAAGTPQQSGLLAAVGRAVTSAAAAAAAAGPSTPAIVRSRRQLANQQPAAATAAPTDLASTVGNGSSGDDDTVVVHVHFGMSGAFRTSLLPGPDATPTTRLRLVHSPSQLVAHLSAMTVQHGSLGLYQEKVSKCILL
jgi:hypothetical protein